MKKDQSRSVTFEPNILNANTKTLALVVVNPFAILITVF